MKLIINFIIVPLIFGLFIYILAEYFPNWIVFYFPDFLWIFSFTSVLLLIWDNKINFNSFFILLFPLLSAFLFEYCQKIGIIKGTFDIFDLITYLIGFFVSIVANQKYNKFLTIKTNNK